MATKPAAKPAKSPKAAPKKSAAKAPAAKPAKAPTRSAAKPAAAKKAAAPAPAVPDAAEEAHAKSVDRQIAKAEHQHQDPRGPAHQPNPAAQGHALDPRKDQGAIRNRGVPRMNKIVNWFRRGQGR